MDTLTGSPVLPSPTGTQHPGLDHQSAINRLALCEAPHIRYRSWSDSPLQAAR